MTPAEREELRSLARQARAQLGTQRAVADALGVGSTRMVRKLEAGTAGVSHLPALRAITQQRYRDATEAARARQTSGRARAERAPVIDDPAAGQTFVAGRSDVQPVADRLDAAAARGQAVAFTFDYRDDSGRVRTGTIYAGWKGPAGADAAWLARELDNYGTLDAFVGEHAADTYQAGGIAAVLGVTVSTL